MSKWMETKDGRIIDVRFVGETCVAGFLIVENDFKLRFGDFVIAYKNEVKDDDLLLQ